MRFQRSRGSSTTYDENMERDKREAQPSKSNKSRQKKIENTPRDFGDQNQGLRITKRK